MKWVIAPDHRLQWKSWGDESVVYDNVSGDTHLLGAAATHILAILSEKTPRDLGSVAEELAVLWETANDNSWVESVRDILNDLHALTLVKIV